MSGDLIGLRQSAPDLARADPLSKEVREWLDRAYHAVKTVDEAEGVIFRMHERYLLHPREKGVAGAQLVETLDRAVRTSAVLHQMGVVQRTPR